MRVGVTYVLPEKLSPYVEAVRRAGLEPVPMSPADPATLAGLRGLVITGGGDVDPLRYGEEPHAETKYVSRKRDDFEAQLIEDAYRNDLPVLAICRGLQILNVARGGSLIQHVERHRDVEHTIHVEPNSKLSVILGEDEYTVNSRHHQAAGRVAPGLVVTARSTEDGLIEGLEDPERRFVVAVQWHPEDRIDREVRDLRLFRAFAKAVGE